MELTSFLNRNYKRVATVTFAFTAVALLVTFIQPLKYRAQAQLLVVQEFDAGTDAYAVSRLNEYVSGVLTRIVTSETFFNQTLEAGFAIDKDYFAGSRKKQANIWEDTIAADTHYDSGLMTLSVYHPDKEQALNISRAAIATLKTKNNFYHSVPKVDVRIIDSPSVSLLPVKPNIALNLLAGLIVGLLAGSLYAYYREQQTVPALTTYAAASSVPYATNFQSAPAAQPMAATERPDNQQTPSNPLW